jgi:hypothetical protein
MSFKRARSSTPSPNVTDLTAKLLAEFRTPNPDAEAQPIIIAGPPEPAAISRLVVIWDAWTDLSAQERSEIIMAAYTTHVGTGEAVKISIAMGLTSQEAQKIRIP